MALKPGDQAPDFEAVTHHGDRVRISDIWKDNPVVLFFYPKAFTPGCTAEACHFRDLESEFAKAGAKVFGISSDGQEKQGKFADEYSLPFLLLADPDSKVSKLYEVKRALIPFAKRVTFVIDKGGKILDVIHDEMSMNVHADRALEVLSGLDAKEGGS
jgi:peroxiredoxin Q/BCP